jgi:hypothetical protein
MHMAFYGLRAAMIGARERNRGAEAVLELCGGAPDSKGSANGDRMGARAARGPGEDISRHGKGVKHESRTKECSTSTLWEPDLGRRVPDLCR